MHCGFTFALVESIRFCEPVFSGISKRASDLLELVLKKISVQLRTHSTRVTRHADTATEHFLIVYFLMCNSLCKLVVFNRILK